MILGFEEGGRFISLGNVLIFGDSYSTYKGYIPEGYAVYYQPDGGDTDVRKVNETWWHKVISETDSNLLLNNSWSGSTIGYTGYNNSDVQKLLPLFSGSTN